VAAAVSAPGPTLRARPGSPLVDVWSLLGLLVPAGQVAYARLLAGATRLGSSLAACRGR
jgi:hypothetical protein